jgi:sugar/nucleoside kinase (ribokinase family)
MQLVDQDRAIALYGHMATGGECSGGSAANTAAGVVACGGTAAFIGTVAPDQLGEIFAHDIRAAGVSYQTPAVTSGSETGRSMILVTPDGERSMNTFIGVSSEITLEHIDRQWLEASAITYVEGYLFDDAHPLEAWLEVAATIHNAGRKFAITLSDPFCVDRHRALFLALLDGPVDICFGNEEEVRMLFEVEDLDAAMTELAKRCEVGAITRGAAGSVIVSGDQRIDIPAELTTVIDTTGAGDLYAAGVLMGLAHGWDLERCGRLGSRAASAIVSRMGARLMSEISVV